ncbi:MAG: sulfatase-like hydrolase/transferase [Planctomycetaceae bacterium]
MNRTSIRVSAATLLLLVPASAAPAADKPPNVVLFLVDDMGWMDSSAYGSTYYETPHMERLAAQSMRFTDAYATPLCSPTRASILTGQYSSRHGVTSASGHLPPQPADAPRYPANAPPNRRLVFASSRIYLDPENDTLPEALRDAGYRTGHIGKWHLGLTPPHWPEKQGFETAFHCAPDPGPPSYFSPYGVVPEAAPRGRRKVGTITDGPDGEYITQFHRQIAVVPRTGVLYNPPTEAKIPIWQTG